MAEELQRAVRFPDVLSERSFIFGTGKEFKKKNGFFVLFVFNIHRMSAGNQGEAEALYRPDAQGRPTDVDSARSQKGGALDSIDGQRRTMASRFLDEYQKSTDNPRGTCRTQGSPRKGSGHPCATTQTDERSEHYVHWRNFRNSRRFFAG